MLIKADGIEPYYSKSGSGHPLILLHGNSQSSDIVKNTIADLSRQYTVYAVDSRCHGQSTDTEDLSYQLMSDDVIAFIQALALDKPYLYGFSDGAVVGLLIASQRPQLLGKLAVSGATTTAEGMKNGWQWLFKLSYFFRRDKRFKLVLTQPAIGKAELSKIAVPTLLLFGEKGITKPQDIHLMSDSIPGSILKTLSGEGHMSYVNNSAKLAPLLCGFYG